MSKMNLKPCPFCGSKAELKHGTSAIFDTYAYVQCKDCGAKTYDMYMSTAYSCDDKVIELWNRRSEAKCDSGTTEQ